MNMKIYTDGTDLIDSRPDIMKELFFDNLQNMFSEKLKEKKLIPVSVQCVEVSIVFLAPEKMSEINSQYRQIDNPTDVLSFPMWENDFCFLPPADWEVLPLGDILICPDAVAENAAENKKTFTEELVLVLSHGLLHLIGYDHDSEEKEREMWAEQESMVRSFFKKEAGSNDDK